MEFEFIIEKFFEVFNYKFNLERIEIFSIFQCFSIPKLSAMEIFNYHLANN